MNIQHLVNKRTFSATLVAVLLAGCNSIAVRGSGTPYEVTHNLDRIQQVQVKGNGELSIQNGTEDKLIVLAQEEIHEHLVIRQVNDRLIIEPEDGHHFKNTKTLRYVLITNDLESIHLAGALELTASDYRTENLTIDASGSIDVDATLYADAITVDASGAFDGYLSGDVNTLTLDFSGSSDLNAYDLTANDVEIDVSGAGTAYVTALERLDVSAAGASSVTYKGNPRVSQSSAGASSVTAAD